MSQELTDLSLIAKYLIRLDTEIESMETALSQIKRDREVISREVIPGLMSDVGMMEFKLDEGTEIKVDQKYYANISEDRAVEALKWLRENGQESLIKTFIVNDFGSGMEDKVDLQVLTNFLNEKDMLFTKKESVHPQTLKAFVKTQVESKVKDFPLHTFGVFVTDETVIKRRKTK